MAKHANKVSDDINGFVVYSRVVVWFNGQSSDFSIITGVFETMPG